MQALSEFMNQPIGRGARVILGVLLIGIGIAVGGAGGVLISVVGLGPIALGTSGRCILELITPRR
ncbi:MAG: DUF2892 domain-containing protein [Chloroflexi bacterium]|nr:DUF2892 domain-containing protein [Chloroflexota bacterium]MDA1003913.1 DUF2892 domain-containing protein [Chloroflexota bacterium]